MEKNRINKKSRDEEDDDENKLSGCRAYEDILDETDLTSEEDSDLDIDSDDYIQLPHPATSTSETVPMHKYPFKLKQGELG